MSMGCPEMADADSDHEVRQHEEHRARHWHERLLVLCDGVFAISITLLAADISVPVVAAGDLTGLWTNLAPQIDAYALSFVVISVYWLAHRRFTAMIRTADAPVTVLTLVTLGLVALLPAATRLAHTGRGHLPSMLIYSGLVVTIGASLAVTWGYASLIAGLVPAHVRLWQRWFYFALMLLTPPLFLLLMTVVPNAGPGVVPIGLAALFLIGWRMRLWMIRRFGGLP